MPRPTGLTSAAGALRYWERRQELVANNLANVATDGYKGDRGFARLVGAGTVGESTAVQSAVDLRPGTLRQTGNPLDVALANDGFFVVQPRGTEGAAAERWTRAGSFQLDANRQLVDADGAAALENDARNECLGHDGQVGASARRLEIGRGCGDA